MAEITGYAVEELVGMPFLDIVAPDYRDTIAQRYQLRMSGQKVPSCYETMFQCKGGLIKDVELSAAIIQSRGSPADMLMIRDINDQKLLQKEKDALHSQLLQAQKMEAIGQLAGGIAHDFNNLLTVIQGHSDFAMMEVGKSNSLTRDLEEIGQAARQASGLTRQLLLFSRKQPTKTEPLNLNLTIHELNKMLHRLIGEDITLRVNFEPDLWMVMADEGNLEQVLMNLVVNARDAMPQGGQIVIKTENLTLDQEKTKGFLEARPGNFVRLSVFDTGCAMDEDLLNRIFEPFFTTKEIGKSTGLGLSVVYGIVKQHQGWITVHSQPGQGSAFAVHLPAFPTHRFKKEKTEIITPKELQGKGERILLVEDDEGVRKFTTRVLRENGYIVFEVASAQRAWEIFEQEKGNFDLAVTDVVLADQTGLDLINHLLSLHPGLRILLTSGYLDEKAQWAIISERGFPFLQKPFTIINLLQSVRLIFDQ